MGMDVRKILATTLLAGAIPLLVAGLVTSVIQAQERQSQGRIAYASLFDASTVPAPSASTQPAKASVETRPVQPPPAPQSDAENRRVGSAPARHDRGWAATLIALAIVAVILLVLRLVLKRLAPAGRLAGSSGPFQGLAAIRLSPRHQVHLVRMGRRLLVIGLAGDTMTSLGEVTDPAEIDELLAKKAGTGGTAASFAAVVPPNQSPPEKGTSA